MNPSTFLKTALSALFDCLFCWLSWIGSVFVFTYLMRSTANLSLFGLVNSHIWLIIPVCAVSFAATGVYKSLWQHPGIGSMIRLTLSVFLASFAMYVSLRIRRGYWENPGLGMMAFYFMLTLTLAVRMYPRVADTVREYLRRFINKPNAGEPEVPIRTLLVGAGESASAFLLHQNQHGNRPRKVLGIVDNNRQKHGYSLHGVNVMGGDDKIPELSAQLDIDELVVAVPSMKNEDLRRIVRLTPVKRCKVRLMSGLSDGNADNLREINIGDLLGRQEKNLDTQAISEWVRGKTALITGGGGSIGGEICRQLLNFDVGKLIIYDISENNAHNLKDELSIKYGQKGVFRTAVRIGSVLDEKRLDEVFEEYRPSIVFHAAAYKHVPLMEECPRLALENNVLGTYRTALCASRHSAERFIMISTDKAVNPTNVMGASKRLAELALLSLNSESPTEFICVRFGNVLDSNGSVIPRFKRQIEAGGPVTVTHPDIIRYFMTIPEAARLVLEAGAMANGGEIFILDMGEPVKIIDLAENLIRMAGLTPGTDIRIEITGLRPGEKLYEELLLNEEGLGRTANNKIFVAKPAKLRKDEREALIAEIESTLSKDSGIRETIQRFVPEYQPK